jgi:hypothetical protein
MPHPNGPEASPPDWDMKAAYREGFAEREQDFDYAWENSLTKHRTEGRAAAVYLPPDRERK